MTPRLGPDHAQEQLDEGTYAYSYVRNGLVWRGCAAG